MVRYASKKYPSERNLLKRVSVISNMFEYVLELVTFRWYVSDLLYSDVLILLLCSGLNVCRVEKLLMFTRALTNHRVDAPAIVKTTTEISLQLRLPADQLTKTVVTRSMILKRH